MDTVTNVDTIANMGANIDMDLDTMNPEYTLSDFFTENHYGLMGVLLACVLIGISTGYMLLDLLIPVPTKPGETDESKRIREYETGYLDELEALEDDGNGELSEPEKEKLSRGKVEDDTPFGPIIMTYSVDDETYWYYTDNKSTPYKTLDAVARQFAVKYSCKRICVNYKEEWEKAKALAIAEQEAEESAATVAAATVAKEELESKAAKNKTSEDSQEQAKPRDVFVKFKKYNKTVEKDAQETKKKARKDSIKRRRYRISAERSNRFTHKGRIADYVDPTIPKSEPPPRLSFADFKAKKV